MIEVELQYWNIVLFMIIILNNKFSFHENITNKQKNKIHFHL
jgi:hypothetical protein